MVDQVLALPEESRVMILAPIVKDRKGEHLHVFRELRAQGFVRARIDGIVTDLDETPVLDKKKKHSISVVVDRFRIRSDIKIRLADSFETAVQVSDGLAAILSWTIPSDLISSFLQDLPAPNVAIQSLNWNPGSSLLTTLRVHV
jgi:excinuclease ABC subunit A